MGIVELAVQAAQEFSKPQATIVQFVNEQAPIYSFDPATGEEYRCGKRTSYREPNSTPYNPQTNVADPFFEESDLPEYLKPDYHVGLDNSARLHHYVLATRSTWDDSERFVMLPIDVNAIGTPVGPYEPRRNTFGWQTVKEEKPKTAKPQIAVPFDF